MIWIDLLNIGIGAFLGFGIFLMVSAKRRLKGAEDEATRMYVASIRALADRMMQLSQVTAESPSESESEEMFRYGMSKGQEMVATELNKMADQLR